jgi:2-C-methyl-D-erythritol 4-phosphate cytidylyltransferase
VPLKDTVKILDENNLVTRTPDRKSMWAIQTPQAFKFELIKWAHEKARSEGTVTTDDCALVENMGGDVKIVMGDYRNIKATTPEDLIVLKSFIGI